MLLKRLISYFLLPYPLVLVLLIIGILLLWFTSRQRAGKVLVTVGLVILFIVSWPLTNKLLLTPLHGFEPLNSSAATTGVRWVVVLGGGYSKRGGLPASARLSAPCLVRLFEGIRLVRALPGSRLVVSGGAEGGGEPIAAVMADAAVSLGVPRADIVLEANSIDTADEARLVRDIVHDEKFVLVTSTIHMRRSMRLFEKQGLRPIAAPAGFWSHETGVLPSSLTAAQADYADHEYLGMLWASLRGKI